MDLKWFPFATVMAIRGYKELFANATQSAHLKHVGME